MSIHARYGIRNVLLNKTSVLKGDYGPDEETKAQKGWLRTWYLLSVVISSLIPLCRVLCSL